MAPSSVISSTRSGRGRRGKDRCSASSPGAIAGAIERGALANGTRLPSERILAEALAVGRGTAVAAYDLLVGSLIIERRRGSGTYVHLVDPLPLPSGREGGRARVSRLGPPRLTAVPRGLDPGDQILSWQSVTPMRTKCGLGGRLQELRIRLLMPSEQHFRVVETTGLEPATFCLQSRDHTCAGLAFRASLQVSVRFISSI